MKSVVLFSGGLDSTVLLYRQIEKYGREEVATYSVHYGQRHLQELEYAGDIAEKLGLKVAASVIRSGRSGGIWGPFGGSSQTNDSIAVPFGHYADESMKATFVPNRNMVMLSLAASFALANDCYEISYAAHAGDHAIYPDCRPEFLSAVQQVLDIANYKPVKIDAPFIRMSKADIVHFGESLKVPFDLTWSCYVGGEKHCGRCGTCVERREAFEVAGVKDPTEYLG